MPLATSRQLLDLLRQERILGEASLEEAERLAAPMPEPRSLATRLIQLGLLTEFQVNHLFQGKCASLILKDYVLLDLLGEGAMGKVYRARHTLMNRIVALKVMRPEALDSPQAVKRFEREMQVATQVDHPNIVRALDAGRSGSAYFFVMEYVNGIDLARLVEEQGPLPVPLACDFARQVALGLQHIHERGGVHRDIKPQNLVAAFKKTGGDPTDKNSYEVVKILDLGLAIVRPPEADGKTMLRLTRVGAVMGTPDFMAPEQTTDAHSVDIRADLYSLGCTLYYLLTGQPLFYAGSVAQKLFQHRAAPVPDLRKERPEVPEGLVQTLKVLLAKRREDRYETPGQAAQALSVYCDPEAIQAKAPGRAALPPPPPFIPPKPPPVPLPVRGRRQEADAPQARPKMGSTPETLPPRRRWVWVLAGVIMFGLGLAALLLFLLNRGSPESGELADKKEDLKKEPAKIKDEGPAKVITNSLKMKLVWIEPGRFQMGSPVGETDRGDNELQHDVEITQGFYLGAFEVTQDEYRQVMGGNPSSFNAAKVGKNTDDFPVELVSWKDAMEFCRLLTAKEKDTGRVYDLPTEAEWEYACRAGTRSVFAFGDALDSNQANFYGDYPYGGAPKGPYLGRTTNVGAYKANAWGLYDMHGNVYEWCKDLYGKDYYPDRGLKDPTGPATGTGRVLRGGSWSGWARGCRSAQRHFSPDDRYGFVGCRVVIRLSPRTP